MLLTQQEFYYKVSTSTKKGLLSTLLMKNIILLTINIGLLNR